MKLLPSKRAAYGWGTRSLQRQALEASWNIDSRTKVDERHLGLIFGAFEWMSVD